MVVRRWRQRAGPAVLALGVVGLLGAGSAGAEEVAWTPVECTTGTAGLALATGAPADAAAASWYRIDPRLDASGRQVAQRVSVGGPAGGAVRTVELAAESFAAGPYGEHVLTGSDDGQTSTLRLLDLAAGCARTLATERDVVRRAIVDPGGTTIYEFRVDRRTRADLGVWQRPLDGSSAPRPVLEPMHSDARFGRTFSTELSWTLEGDRLVVQSCGQVACRTRLFDPVTQASILFDEPDLGELVGVAGNRLMTYAPCRGLPCPLIAVDLASGARTTLSDDAGLAVLVTTEAGPRIVHEDLRAGPGHLRVVDPRGAETAVLETDHGVRLMTAASRAQAAIGVPPGWLVLSPDGRPGPDRAREVLLRPTRRDAITPFQEVSR